MSYPFLSYPFFELPLFELPFFELHLFHLFRKGLRFARAFESSPRCLCTFPLLLHFERFPSIFGPRARSLPGLLTPRRRQPFPAAVTVWFREGGIAGHPHPFGPGEARARCTRLVPGGGYRGPGATKTGSGPGVGGVESARVSEENRRYSDGENLHSRYTL